MIVGFVGRLGSGKNTAAERLSQIVASETEFIAFADKLKTSASALFNIHPRLWDRWKNDSDIRFVIERRGDSSVHIADMSAREILQRYGTEAHRDVFGDDFWVDQALGTRGRGIGHLQLVTDVRFPNEVEGIKNRGGVVVEIVGKNDPGLLKDRAGGWINLMTGEAVHPSEYPLEGCDYEIKNGVHDDHFANLDSQLYDLAIKLGLELREVVA